MATPQLPLPLVTTQKPTKPTPLTDTYPISRFSCCWPSAANNFNSLSLMCSCQLFLMAPWRTMGVAGICLLTETYYSHFVYFSGHVLWPIVSWFTIHYGHSKYFYIFLFLFFLYYILYLFLQHPFPCSSLNLQIVFWCGCPIRKSRTFCPIPMDTNAFIKC